MGVELRIVESQQMQRRNVFLDVGEAPDAIVKIVIHVIVIDPADLPHQYRTLARRAPEAVIEILSQTDRIPGFQVTGPPGGTVPDMPSRLTVTGVSASDLSG